MLDKTPKVMATTDNQLYFVKTLIYIYTNHIFSHTKRQNILIITKKNNNRKYKAKKRKKKIIIIIIIPNIL